MKANSTKIGNILNLSHLSREPGKGWIWDVVEEGDVEDENNEYIPVLVEYSTNESGEGLWRTGKDYDGSIKYNQISGTDQFGTYYGSQKRSAIRARLVRYFAEEA